MDGLLAFALVAGVLTLAPGVDTLLVIRSAISGGRGAGLAAGLGVITGLMVWAVASAVGVTAILVASQRAFIVLQVLGSAYLLWLGIQALRSALRGEHTMIRLTATNGVSVRHAYRMGMTTNLLNPKVGVFYLSIFPQFLPDRGNAVLWSLGLASIHAVEGLIWLGLIAAVVGVARAMLMRPSIARALEAISGLTLVGFGARIAWDVQRRSF